MGLIVNTILIMYSCYSFNVPLFQLTEEQMVLLLSTGTIDSLLRQHRIDTVEEKPVLKTFILLWQTTF